MTASRSGLWLVIVHKQHAPTLTRLPALTMWGSRNLGAHRLCPSTAPPPLTPIVVRSKQQPNQLTLIMPTTLKEFESVWPRIVADLQDHCKGYNLPKQSLDWFTKVFPPLNETLKHAHQSPSRLTTTPSVENATAVCLLSTLSLS